MVFTAPLSIWKKNRRFNTLSYRFCKAHGDFQDGYSADTIENVHLGKETSFEMHRKCS
jgi:hypothetical protein